MLTLNVGISVSLFPFSFYFMLPGVNFVLCVGFYDIFSLFCVEIFLSHSYA